MERPGDAAVQGRIGVAEDDPDRAPELLQPGDHLVARPDRGQQVFVQAKEGRAGTRRGVELLVQQRHELTSHIRVSDEAPDPTGATPFLAAISSNWRNSFSRYSTLVELPYYVYLDSADLSFVG